MGAHCQVIEPDGSLRLNRFGRPTARTLLFRKEHAEPILDWNTIGMRGHRVRGLSRHRPCLCRRPISGTREDPALRRDTGPLYAFTMQGLYAVGVAAVAFGIARAMLDEFIALATEKTPRGLQRLADSPVVQADVARREAHLGPARAWLVEILKEVWANADDIAPIDLNARVRVRLGCAHAISTAVDVADLRLQSRRDFRHLPRHSVRAPLPGHPYFVAANPVPRLCISKRSAGPCSTAIRTGYSSN